MISCWIYGLKCVKVLEFGLNSILVCIIKQLENLIALLNIDIFWGINCELLHIIHFVTVHIQKADQILRDHGLFCGKIFRLEILTNLETLKIADQHEQEWQGIETAFVEVEDLLQNQEQRFQRFVALQVAGGQLVAVQTVVDFVVEVDFGFQVAVFTGELKTQVFLV
jgi:hypothetical protein